ncbi:MAG: NUDIX hydrolase [Erysipelotrichales bacterium]|nr:NUDIX hydrolase [Erysipelotrichales bacterium]
MKTRKIISELESIRDELSILSIRKIPDLEKNFLTVETYQIILKDNTIFNRQKLVKNKRDGSAVVVVPITKDNKSLVIVQPRVFSESGIGVEIPAGYIDPGETPEDAAIRELREETGYDCEKLIPLKSYYQDQGISGAHNTCFLALGCEKKYDQRLDRDEYIKYLECTFNDLVYLVNNGIINDANGIIAINEAKKYLRKLR